MKWLWTCLLASYDTQSQKYQILARALKIIIKKEEWLKKLLKEKEIRIEYDTETIV